MASSKPTEIGSTKMFEGFNKRYKHQSSTLGCSMNFHIYFPPSTSPDQKFPVLYWLSGLTCTDENFIVKSGAQRVASTEGIALIVPDTSPRGLNVEGESDSYDFGVGAGFYLNATVEKWKNWQMYDYIVKELPKLLTDNFPQLDTSRASISGHSMGGHGALTIYLKNLDKYKSVSAFAPIVNPINCPWGQKAFTNYLGDDKTSWEEYDATCLITKFNDVGATIMIDQGDDDKFLHENQLLPNKFDEACRNVKAPLLLRMQPGYDHSYHFVATFIDDHIRHHAQALNPRRHPHTVSDEVISQSILVSNTMPSTSEEEHRIEDEYLDVGSVGESEFDNGSRKGKHKYEGDTNGLSGMRRMKKSYGSSKYDALLEVWSESMIARKERDLAKIEQYKSKYVDVRSSLVEEYSIGDCMTTLEATLGVSSRSYIKALSFFPDINWRKMFLMMSENRRKEWLDSLDK